MQQPKRDVIFAVLFGLFLCAGVFTIYWPALHGGFLWDDDAWTTGILNLLRDAGGLRLIWTDPLALQQYYPLTASSFWLDYHFWKLWTLPYHVENVGLHLIAVLLFWRLLWRLEIPGAWLAAGIFAVHPVMVESVAWITERKNVLSLVFFLGALLAYGRCNLFWKTEENSRRNWGAYGAGFLLFVLALLAKTTTSCLPAVALLICWWKRGRIEWKRDALPSLPFFAVGICFSAITGWLEKNHVGAMGWEWDLTFWQRLLVAGRAFWFYLGKLFWPKNLCFLYARWKPDTGALWQWLFPVAMAATVAALWWRRRKIGRGPAAAGFYFVGTLFPVLGFMNAYGARYSYVWDHWVYLPSLGLIVIAVAGLANAVLPVNRPVWLACVGVVLLPLLGVLTWRQSASYKDLETLWRTTIAKNPEAFLAYNNLGYLLMERGQLDDSIAYFNKSIAINPGFSEPHNNLGDALIRKGQTNDGIYHFQKAVELADRDTNNFVAAHYNLGNAWLQLGRANDAMTEFTMALKAAPDFAKARNNLGCALLQLKRTNEAMASFKKAIESDPEFADAHNNLADLLILQGETDAAMEHFGLALKYNPNQAGAFDNYVELLKARGKLEEAVGCYEQAIAAHETPELHNDLANILVSQRRLDEAIKHYGRAVQLKPDDGEFHYNFAVVLGLAGKLDESIAEFRRTIELMPKSAQAHYRLGLALQGKKDYAGAMAEYEATLNADASHGLAMNNLAWLLATCPEDSLRNGKRAVELALESQRLAGANQPDVLDTLAAAYAEAGKFSDAVETAKRALELARAQNNTVLTEHLEARLKCYEGSQAWREKG